MTNKDRVLRMSALVAIAAASTACAQPECVTPNYANAECRVLMENELARTRTPSGVEVRFQEPAATTPETWSAGGLLESPDGQTVRARVAGPGMFSLSLASEDGEAATVELVLDNVDPRAVVSVETSATLEDIPAAEGGGLQRAADVTLQPGETTWVRGALVCPSRFRLAFASDIQTNPGQFERIVERLRREAEEGAAADEPLLGLVVAGDLSESSRFEEFERIDQIARGAPAPVAVTSGNHDIYRPLRPLYNRTFGPGNYALSICGLRLVMLDSGSGAIADSVEARLGELFERPAGDRLIVSMHHPPHAGLTGSGWSDEQAATRLLVEAAAASADLIVAGHSHALHDFDDIPIGDRRIREVVAGTAGAYQGLGTPRYGYVRVTVDASGVETCFVETPPPGYDGPQNEQLSSRLPQCD